MKPELSRVTRRWERGSTWFVVSLVAVAGLLGLGVAQLVGGTFRGHTTIGVVLGVIAIGAAVASGWYSVRKRRQAGGSASMMAWLWAHVVLGVVGLVAALLHAGPASLAPRLTSGWLLLAAFLLLVGSGIWWRLVYRRVPRVVHETLRSPNPESSRARAQQLEVEMEKLAAGRSETFQSLKARLLGGGRDLQAAVDRLSADERQVFTTLAEMAHKRSDALERIPRQERAAWRLQGWRWVHIPLVGLVLVLFAVHLGGAAELPAKIAPSLAGFENVDDCASCHAQIADEWRGSMHAFAMRSPVMVVQNNVAVRTTLVGAAEKSKDVCVNCHGPIGAMLDGGVTLPLEDGAYDRNAGIDCVTCHQVDPERGAHPEKATLHAPGQDPKVLSFGLSALAGLDGFQDFYSPGRKYFGRSEKPVGNSFHRSDAHPVFERDGDLCASCHNVHLDNDGDGQIVKGKDLVLQTLVQEWEELGQSKGTCIECHMPARQTPTVDAFPWMGVDGMITRSVRSHLFVGVDYPLDKPDVARAHRADREDLLRSAATLELVGEPAFVGGSLQLTLRITNTGSGHRLPSGFAFARQLWIEVIVRANGQEVFTSGRLAGNDQDLCDSDTMNDALAQHVRGCPGGADAQLVNLQGVLLDRVAQAQGPDGPINVAAEGAKETPVQFPTSGPIPRKRPAGGSLAPIDPGESRQFTYQVASARVDGMTIEARLRFRNLPPYFLRGLDALRGPDEGPDLTKLLGNLEIVDIASARAVVR